MIEDELDSINSAMKDAVPFPFTADLSLKGMHSNPILA